MLSADEDFGQSPPESLPSLDSDSRFQSIAELWPELIEADRDDLVHRAKLHAKRAGTAGNRKTYGEPRARLGDGVGRRGWPRG